MEADDHTDIGKFLGHVWVSLEVIIAATPIASPIRKGPTNKV